MKKKPTLRRKAPTHAKVKPGSLVLAALVLVGLLFLGTFLFHTQKSTIDQWEYPRKYDEYVTYYAGKYGIDPLLLDAFIRTESNFDPKAESNVGARGLMQITEITYDWIKSKIAPAEDLTFDSLYDPETNIRFGSYFVSYCLQWYAQDIPTAAAAYHSGWGTVDGLLADTQYSANGKTLDNFPYTQMRLYVAKITDSYANYQRVYGTENS